MDNQGTYFVPTHELRPNVESCRRSCHLDVTCLIRAMILRTFDEPCLTGHGNGLR
jgi:hypothetical protein